MTKITLTAVTKIIYDKSKIAFNLSNKELKLPGALLRAIFYRNNAVENH